MNKKDIKIVFIGSANFSVPILQMLIMNYTVELIITEEDKAAGRGKKILAPPTKLIAQENNINYIQPSKVKNNCELLQQINKIKPTILIVAAYGKILPKELLEINNLGCINVHPSLLPKYRGPAPIQTALLNGDIETGISIIKLNNEMDAGDVLVYEKIKIGTNTLYKDLEIKLAKRSAEMLDEILLHYINKEIALVEQNDNGASFCYKIDKLDGRINFNESADVIYNKYRAYHLWPGIYCFYKKSKLDFTEIKKIDIDESNKQNIGTIFKKNKAICIMCLDSALEIIKLKLEGRKETPIIDFINGHQDFVGTVLE